MPTLRRNKVRQEKHKPEIVTGGFELHYEDVINRNRFSLILFFATGLIMLAAFIPNAVYQSVANEDHIMIEAESGSILNSDFVTKVEGDMTASDNSYIEFRSSTRN
ncbi:MAG: hypothetical protein M3Q14_04530 [bacterium]|nr:hypothetical protein [bacterium]